MSEQERVNCPNGHEIHKARGLSCMVKAGYYWCGRCESESRFGWRIPGMYYPPSRVVFSEEYGQG